MKDITVQICVFGKDKCLTELSITWAFRQEVVHVCVVFVARSDWRVFQVSQRLNYAGSQNVALITNEFENRFSTFF